MARGGEASVPLDSCSRSVRSTSLARKPQGLGRAQRRAVGRLASPVAALRVTMTTGDPGGP